MIRFLHLHKISQSARYGQHCEIRFYTKCNTSKYNSYIKYTIILMLLKTKYQRKTVSLKI